MRWRSIRTTTNRLSDVANGIPLLRRPDRRRNRSPFLCEPGEPHLLDGSLLSR